MQLAELHTQYEHNRQGKKYRLKDASDATILEQAEISFNRLPQKQREKVEKSWTDYLFDHKEETTALYTSDQEALTALKLYRFMAQTNLFFLCFLLEKYNQVTEKTHENICNEFFVQKDPTYKTFEAYAHSYNDLKRRLLLTPRGGFKSSLNMADSVQWIICFPAITMLILTGTLTLATDFVGEIKQHFTLEETGVPDAKGKSGFGPRKLMNKETGEWTPSLFQVLFPEHCTPPGDGKQTEFQTPAGGDDKEPTVRAASIEQALSGMHFGILKLDDVVTNENSLTVTRLQAVNKQISINRAMLHPYGFFDVIGTWYDEQDFYGITIKQEEKFAKDKNGLIIGSVDSGQFESAVNFKVYLRAAWWPNKAAIAANKIEEELTEADMELWFPERLTYKALMLEKETDADGFPIKYLNNPRKLHQVKFPRELLLRRTILHNQLPQQGIIVTTVDTAYSVKSWADYTVIITALIFGGRFYIVNMVRGRFNEDALPAVIAATAFKWKPKRIAIEESVGVKWMGKELRREMDKLQIVVPIEYVSLGLGSKTTSKKLKAKPVVRLLGDERMFFSNSCEGLQEIYTELEKFTGTSDDTHDDIVSALSLMADQFGAYADMEQKISYSSTQYVADLKSKERHDQIYGLGKYAQYNAAQMIEDNPVTVYQMAEGRRYRDEVGPSDVDPLGDLM